MATIKLKNGSGAPLASDLVQGEPALDLTNKRLYTEDSLGAVIEVGVNPTELNVTNDITVGGTVDGRDIATDGAKLDGIEAGADVTDTTNVTAAGAVMDSELTSEASVKALDQGVATTDSPTFAGLTTTGNVTFGDNDKATFGAGPDLSIYHDGSNSYITDSGTGDLKIRSNKIRMEAPDSQNMVIVTEDAGVQAFYNGTARFEVTNTGIDVTGTVTADGLTLGNAQYVKLSDTTTDSPRVLGMNSANTTYIGPIDSYDGGGIIYGASSNVNAQSFLTSGNNRLVIGSGGDISFYEDTGTTAKFFWDASAESLGIGNTDPSSFGAFRVTQTSADSGGGIAVETGTVSARLYVDGSGIRHLTAGTTDVINWDASGNVGIGTSSPRSGYKLDVQESTNNGVNIQAGDASSDIALSVGSASTADKFVIEAGGNVGIGTSSPSVPLEVEGSVKFGSDATGVSFAIQSTDEYRINGIDIDGNGFNSLHFRADGTDGLFIEKDTNNVGIGNTTPSTFNTSNAAGNLVVGSGSGSEGITIYTATDSNGALCFADGTTSTNTYKGYIQYNHSTDSMQFATGHTEHMRIDSSGNLLVGTTSTPLSIIGSGTGDAFGYTGNDGYLAISRDFDGAALYLNKTNGAQGTHIQFRADGSTVGSIGYNSFYYIAGGASGGTHAGLRFVNNQAIRPCDASGDNLDNSLDLGASAARFKDLYLSGGAYLGGTAAANKLDDYEEGTFTPTLTFGGADTGNVYAAQAGYYTKVGDTVHVFVSVRLTTLGSAVGNAEITNLPFTVNSAVESAGSVGYLLGLTSLSSVPVVRPSGTKLELRDVSATQADRLTHGNFTSTADLRITATYKV